MGAENSAKGNTPDWGTPDSEGADSGRGASSTYILPMPNSNQSVLIEGIFFFDELDYVERGASTIIKNIAECCSTNLSLLSELLLCHVKALHDLSDSIFHTL